MECRICGDDVPMFFHVMWCDSCIDKCNNSYLSLEEFLKQEKKDGS